MHLGSVISITKYAKKNFKYILLNNNVHESVGGQTTNIENINLKLFSKSVFSKILTNKKYPSQKHFSNYFQICFSQISFYSLQISLENSSLIKELFTT